MNREHLLRNTATIALFSLAIAGSPQTQVRPAKKDQQNAKQQPTSAQTSNNKQSEGQKIFEQNCSRCHTPPDGFSPRISGTIVRHMRVRASLSEHDAQELLRFFNP
jgi:cytochrome c5